MTLSSLKIHLALLLLLAGSTALAADELDMAMAAAERAVAAAEAAQPRGQAATALEKARGQWRAAGETRRKRDALRLAEAAAANADLAHAQARLDAARLEVESRAARNADLRRRLLVNGGN